MHVPTQVATQVGIHSDEHREILRETQRPLGAGNSKLQIPNPKLESASSAKSAESPRGARGTLPIFLSDVKARHVARTGCGKPQIPNLKPQSPPLAGNLKLQTPNTRTE
jgi:hypothetical protein